MTKALSPILVLSLFLTYRLPAQTTAALRQKIQQVIAGKRAVVGVSINGNNGNDTLSVNGGKHLPLQSVFKFHIALALLSEIDKGNFSLDQNITIEKKDLLPGLYSPLREKYPQGATLPVSELVRYSVCESDNVACDVLLKLMGGPQAVETYFVKHNFRDVSIKINEEVMQKNWDLQFQNWTTANAANEILAAFYYNDKSLLSKKSHDFIWELMRGTGTGKKRIKGRLPAGTVVAHKTGTSGTNKQGVSAAVNDIGIVFLPGGGHFFISVLVADSRENEATNERIIAEIAKVAWDHFTFKTK